MWGFIVYCFIVLTGRREIMKPNERRAAADYVQGDGGSRVVFVDESGRVPFALGGVRDDV